MLSPANANPARNPVFRRIRRAAAALALLGVIGEAGAQATGGICDRTREVRIAIMDAVPGNCASFDAAKLGRVTALSLRVSPISSLYMPVPTLRAGDFAGLPNLTQLDLTGIALTSLPANVFAGLPNLTHLVMGLNHELGTLPANLFAGLGNLKVLDLHANGLTALPAGIFGGLAKLEHLNLYGNRLTTLPANVFDGLTELTFLSLRSNGLTSLPAGVFDELANLKELNVAWNESLTLSAAALSGLRSLQTLDSTAVKTADDLDANALRNVKVRAVDGNPGALAVSWSPPLAGEDGIAGYSVRWKKQDDGTTTYTYRTGTGGTETDKGLASTRKGNFSYEVTNLTQASTFDVQVATRTGDFGTEGTWVNAQGGGIPTAINLSFLQGSSSATLKDGMMVARYLLGVTGADALLAGLGAHSSPDDDFFLTQVAEAVTANIFDVDESGTTDSTDGFLIVRYLAGMRGAALIAGLDVGDTTAATIQTNIAEVPGVL